MTLKNGEQRQYDSQCPFDCTIWDEYMCENTDAAGIADGFIPARPEEMW